MQEIVFRPAGGLRQTLSELRKVRGLSNGQMVLSLRSITNPEQGHPQRTKEQYNRLTNQELGQQLEDYRKGRGLSLRQLATELGIAHQSLWQHEKGKKRLPPRILRSITAKATPARTSLPVDYSSSDSESCPGLRG